MSAERMRLKQPTDDNILKDLRERCQDVPANIAERIDRNNLYVGERLRQLEDYGLTENVGHGVYAITEKGDQYLDGELDDDELEG